MPLKLNSSGGGSVTIDVPSTASNFTLTAPAGTGNIVTTADSGTVTGTMIAASTVTPAKLSQPLTQMTSVATTSGTAIDFTGIPSWAKRISVIFNGVSLSGTANFRIQVGVGSTPTTTGYNCGSLAYSATGVAGITSTAGFDIYFTVATYNPSGVFRITNVSGNIWVIEGNVLNTTTATVGMVVGGNVTLAGSLGMVRITTSNGTDTFDAGTVNVMYE